MPPLNRSSSFTFNVTPTALSGAFSPDSEKRTRNHLPSTYEDDPLQGGSYKHPPAAQSTVARQAVDSPAASTTDPRQRHSELATRRSASRTDSEEIDHPLVEATAALLQQRPYLRVSEIARELRRREADVRSTLRHGRFGMTSNITGRRPNGKYYFLPERTRKRVP